MPAAPEFSDEWMAMQTNRTIVARGLLGVLLLAGVISCLIPSRLTPPLLTTELRQEAESKFRQVYQREPDHFDTVSIAAELAVSRDQLEVANQCFAEIPTSHPLYGPGARFQQGQVLLKLNQAAAAERQFREYLDLPGVEFRNIAQEFLRYILEIELRFEERQTLLMAKHASSSLTPTEAMFAGFSSLLRWNGEAAVDRCRQFYELDPENPQLQIAWAQYLGGSARAVEGLQVIDTCLVKEPANARAIAVKMYLLSELGEDQPLAALVATLLPPQRSDPWIMLRLRGAEALSRNDLDRAEQCYRLLLEVNPAVPECDMGLAEIAGKRKQPEQQAKFLETARRLALIQNRLGALQFLPTDDPSFYVTLAEQALAIGLKPQAQLMAEAALKIDPKNAVAKTILQECQP